MPINFLHDVDINGEIKGNTLNIDGAADITGNITGLNGSLTTTSSYYQLNTPSGYIQMGAMNTGHAHMYTDRPDFYFNKAISINGANVLTTANTDAYFQNSDVVMNENPFGGRSLYNSMINNPWFLAADRYTVTQTGGTSIANAFNGDYESSYTVAANGTATFNIDFGQHPGYPYGWIYLSFYYTHQPSSISGRVYNNYAPHTVGWSALTFTDVVNTSQQRIVKARQSKYGLTDLEITLTAPAGTTVRLTSCEIHLDRPGTQEMPVFNKFRPETIYKALTVNSTITSTGKITGTELEGTSLDINGAANFKDDGIIIDSLGGPYGRIHGTSSIFLGGSSTSNVQLSAALIPDGDSTRSLGNANRYWSHTYTDAITTTGKIECAGELEGASLDINGNADISGNLTGVDAFTASGKIQGAELEGTSLDINGRVDFQTISTSGDGTVVRGGFLNPAAEASMVHIPHLINDLAGFQKWSNSTITVSGLYKTRSGSSGSYTYSNAVTSSDFNGGQAFDAHSSTAGSWYSDNGVDGNTAGVGVITLEWPNELTYSAWAGIVFGSGSFTAPRVKIEAYRAGAWQTLCNITDNNQNVVLRQIANNSGTGNATTKLRYTLGGSVNGSYFRIHTLYAANYRAGDNSLNNTSTSHTQGVNFLEKYKDGYLHGNLYPGANNTYDLGSTSYQWRDIYVDGFIDMGTNQFTDTTVGNWNTAYTHSQAAHAPSNAEQNVQSDWNAASGDALILNKPSIPSISGLATTSYVDTAVANVIDSAPGALDTLNELAAALGDDASFSTTITNSIATKLPLAGGTMTGDIILNDNVEVEFGTGSDVKMKFDGSNFLTTVPAGSAFLIGTNGATPDDNSNKVDFGIDIGADPQISWYGDQINIGGTDMNWAGKVYESGSFNMAAWDRDLYIFTQGSTGASAKNIFLRPQAADGVTTTVAQFNGDTGTTLTGTTTINGALTVNYNGDAVNLRSTTNGQPTNLTFSTNVPDSQIGHIKYSHSNSASYGGGDSFTIGGTETTTVILADGQLMYKDGIYSKPGSGTGAGTRKDANWDTAYTHSQSTHAPTNADATPSWVPSSNPNYLTGTETIVAPASITTTIVDDTVNVSFAASTTSNIDNYLVFSSVAGSDYSLISIIPPDDMSANMSIIDNAFDASGTQAYRIYAVKNGNYSSPRTGSISFSAGTVEATNLNVVNLNKAFYIQWDAPSSKSRFVTAYNVYKHEASASGDLSESSATLIYSGLNTNYMYSVSGSSNSNFHKFWVTTTVV